MINAGTPAEQGIEHPCRQHDRRDQQSKFSKGANLVFQVFKEMHLHPGQQLAQVDATLLQFFDKASGGIEVTNLCFLYRGQQ